MTDFCNFIGQYNNLPLYLIRNEYGWSLWYERKFYKIPKFIEEPVQIKLMQAINIIENRKKYIANKETIKNIQSAPACENAP